MKKSIKSGFDWLFGFSSILTGVCFHFVILYLGNVWRKCWWTPMFEDHDLALFLPHLQPLNFLFNPNSLILSRVLTSNLCLYNCCMRLMMCQQVSLHDRWTLEPILLVICLIWRICYETPLSLKGSPLTPIKMKHKS